MMSRKIIMVSCFALVSGLKLQTEDVADTFYYDEFARRGAIPLQPGQQGKCWFHSQSPWKQDQFVFKSMGGVVGQCEVDEMTGSSVTFSRAQLCDCTAPTDPQKFNQHFVEMGGVDGQMLSNSLFFEAQMGWTGLLVEANPPMYKNMQARRFKSINLHAVIGSEVGKSVNFFMFNTSSWEIMMSCMEGSEHDVCSDEKTARRYAQQKGAVFSAVAVPIRNLDEELRKYKMTSVAWASIDVEGAEPMVFNTIDFKGVSFDLVSYEGSYAGINAQLAENGFHKCTGPQIDTWWASSKHACPNDAKSAELGAKSAEPSPAAAEPGAESAEPSPAAAEPTHWFRSWFR